MCQLRGAKHLLLLNPTLKVYLIAFVTSSRVTWSWGRLGRGMFKLCGAGSDGGLENRVLFRGVLDNITER